MKYQHSRLRGPPLSSEGARSSVGDSRACALAPRWPRPACRLLGSVTLERSRNPWKHSAAAPKQCAALSEPSSACFCKHVFGGDGCGGGVGADGSCHRSRARITWLPRGHATTTTSTECERCAPASGRNATTPLVTTCVFLRPQSGACQLERTGWRMAESRREPCRGLRSQAGGRQLRGRSTFHSPGRVRPGPLRTVSFGSVLSGHGGCGAPSPSSGGGGSDSGRIAGLRSGNMAPCPNLPVRPLPLLPLYF